MSEQPKQPQADPWGSEIQVFAGASPVGEYRPGQLWLAKEWAQDVAREYPGEIVWVLDDGTVSETYRFDPDDGMQTGVAS